MTHGGLSGFRICQAGLVGGLLLLAACGAGATAPARGTAIVVPSPLPSPTATATIVATRPVSTATALATPVRATPSPSPAATSTVGATERPATARVATSVPTPTLTPTPAATVTVRPATVVPPTAPPATARSAGGYLEGRARIGPLTPVEREGVPSPTPSPAVCLARALNVAASGAAAVRVPLQADCTFRVALPAGQYVVSLAPSGIDFSKDLPRTITIAAGQTVRLEISIDTGLR